METRFYDSTTHFISHKATAFNRISARIEAAAAGKHGKAVPQHASKQENRTWRAETARTAAPCYHETYFTR